MISTYSHPAAAAQSSASSSDRSAYEREEETDLHVTGTPSSADRPTLLGRAGEREDHGKAAQVVGGRALRLLAARVHATQLREHAEPVESPQRGQPDPPGRLPMPAELHRSAHGVVDAARPRRAPPGAEELPVAVPRGLRERLGPRSLVRDRRAVGEGEQRLHRGIVLERPVGRAPASRIDLDDLGARDHAQHVDVMDRHVQEIRMGHPATPVAARDPGIAQVAPAGDADARVAGRERRPARDREARATAAGSGSSGTPVACRPARSAAAATAAASGSVSASGFSTITWQPPASASSASGLCVEGGEASTTTSGSVSRNARPSSRKAGTCRSCSAQARPAAPASTTPTRR